MSYHYAHQLKIRNIMRTINLISAYYMYILVVVSVLLLVALGDFNFDQKLFQVLYASLCLV